VFAFCKQFFSFFIKGIKMKKLLSIALVASIFTLVACSAEKGTSNLPSNAAPIQKEKCKGKKCHQHGKLGMENMTDDTAK
jgi:hypothetical protein